MAVVDPARAALITKEFRYAVEQDAAVKALYSNAREIVIETSLDQAGGEALASVLFNRTHSVGQTFTVTAEDVLYLEDFTSAPNRYTLELSRHPNAGSGIFTIIAAKIDFANSRTTLTVRA